MTSRSLLHHKIMCCVLALAVGAADLALCWWLGGMDLVAQRGLGSYWFAVLLLGALFFSLGAGMLAWAIVNIGRAHASVRWPSTRGVVLTSEIDEHTSKSGRFYDPKIRYDYVILGTRYENDTIEFDQRSFDRRDQAEQVAARYPVGAQIDVHYDPEDPQQSCLQCRDDSAVNAVGVALWSFALPFALPLIRPAIEHVFGR